MTRPKKLTWKQEFRDGMWDCNCGMTEENVKKKGRAYHHGWLYFKSIDSKRGEK